MVLEASTIKERYEEMQKNPLFFCRYSSKTEFDTGRPSVKHGWFSCDSTINFYYNNSKDQVEEDSRQLLFVGNQILKSGNIDLRKQKKDLIFFEVEFFNPSTPKHWSLIFNDCFYNHKAGNYRHGAMVLVWALYTTQWDAILLNKVFTSFDKHIQHVIANNINNYLYVFSEIKQRALIEIIKNNIYDAQQKTLLDVENVLKEISPHQNFSNYGFFSKIDFIIDFGKEEQQAQKLHELYSTSLSYFIHYKYWKEHVGHKLYNYSILLDIYSYVSTSEQMLIIKRYLHDVRMNVVTFDENIIKGFRDYKYQSYVDGRYFITSPGSNIMMTAPMFSDAILTLRETNGERLQTFNGILDLAVKNSNAAYPNIDFGVRNFLPYCDGGLIHNHYFLGFVRYDVKYSFEDSFLNEEKLNATVNYILRNYASIQWHWCCTEDNDKTLSDISHCKKIYTAHKKIYNKEGELISEKSEDIKCEFLAYKKYVPNRWKRINSDKDKILSLCIDNLFQIDDMFSYENVSLTKLETAIRKWGSHYKELVFHNGILPTQFSKNDFAKYIIQNFYSPTHIIIYPNKEMFYSSKKSFLNLWQENEITPLGNDKSRAKFVQSKEGVSIFNMTFESLKEMCPDGIVGENCITIPYDFKRLQKIIAYFYHKPHLYDPSVGYSTTDYSRLEFLTKRNVYNIKYCSPKLSKEKEKVLNISFFWCGSDECFCNVLETQTLGKQSDWRKYSLYHAAEIINHKLIKETPDGNIPSEVISNFSAELRQAERLYSRLQCRSCGHMIFSTHGSMLNGSRYFNCLNKQCIHYHEEIYLSQCNTCKSGLIDSRDSKKCPNNWVICPHCLACCNDNLFQSLYNKHLRNGFVPQKIKENLDQGHNNKDLFFCPVCGGPVGQFLQKKTVKENGQTVETEQKVIGCPNCELSFEENKNKYYESTGKKVDTKSK